MDNSIKVFLFHRVSPETDPLWQPMHPARFEQVIRIIQKLYAIIPLEEYLRGNIVLKKGKKYAAIGFDDGYKDFTKYALPVLQKHDIQSSMYIVTDCANTGLPPWTYQVDYLFNNSRKTLIKDGVQYRRQNATVLKNRMKEMPNEKRKELLVEIMDQLDDVTLPADLMMDWRDIEEAHNAGVEIGSHTSSHPVLSSIDNSSDLQYEMQSSFDTLKARLDKPPYAISYPNGRYNEKVMDFAVRAGYKAGLALHQKTYRTSRDAAFEIPRIELYQQSMLKTIARIAGVTDFLK
ncbi:MAG: polysaccharide deacetylase family protein [Ferruginibacter sp.]